jgi:hypothetical protein
MSRLRATPLKLSQRRDNVAEILSDKQLIFQGGFGRKRLEFGPACVRDLRVRPIG